MHRQIEPEFPTMLDPELKQYIDFKILELVRFYRDGHEIILKELENNYRAIVDLRIQNENTLNKMAYEARHHHGTLSHLIQLTKERR